MIRLGKDKTLDNYFIDENGVITDKFGKVQKTYINGGREFFKKTRVHQIMMYTFYEWRDGKVWNIHHKDENKLNNSLSNLIYLTRAEHTSLHTKGKPSIFKGRKISEKTKEKISFSHIGKNTWSKNLIWVNNGIKNKRVKINQIPEGYNLGMLKKI